MKVCTDACTFGAWAEIAGAKRILDIGTGTGLLSLMAAQRNPDALIDAVEIDEQAVSQAAENFKNSPFSSRIKVFEGTIQDFEPGYLYDAILVNPPFYQNDLRSPDDKVNQAHHAKSLTFSELLTAVEKLLKKGGSWHVLLPVEEGNVLNYSAISRDWLKRRELILSHSLKHSPIRIMRSYSKMAVSNPPASSEHLAIYEPETTRHTLAFRQLLRDFYLKF